MMSAALLAGRVFWGLDGLLFFILFPTLKGSWQPSIFCGVCQYFFSTFVRGKLRRSRASAAGYVWRRDTEETSLGSSTALPAPSRRAALLPVPSRGCDGGSAHGLRRGPEMGRALGISHPVRPPCLLQAALAGVSRPPAGCAGTRQRWRQAAAGCWKLCTSSWLPEAWQLRPGAASAGSSRAQPGAVERWSPGPLAAGYK